jgi:hypothetical protein
MSKFLKYFLIVLAFLISNFILLSSFNISSQSQMLDSGKLKTRKFYVQKEILPDHSLYPLLMLVDRFRLEMADRERRVYLSVAYAKRRLFYATRLVEKCEMSLALTTFTKSQKYLNEALIEVKELELTNTHDPSIEQLAFFVIEAVDYQQAVIADYIDDFCAADQVVLKNLDSETALLKLQLSQ